MRYLSASDFNGVLSANALSQLRGTADVNLISAEQNAISELDPLQGRYEIEAELSKTSSDRNISMIRIVANLTAYWLYNTSADVDIPERISENYKTALRDIESFATGKKSTTLTAKTDTEGETKTKFAYGFDTKRQNNPFN